jgi:hypothetical protein
MDPQAIIIKALAGASSDKPMTATELHKIAGPLINNLDVFDDTCEQLYQARIINRCLQQKGGLEQFLYWPTANVSRKSPAFIISNKRHLDATLTPPPRRSEVSQPSTTISKDISMSKSDNKTKFTAVLVVQTALENPGIKFNDLVTVMAGDDKQDFAKARDMLYYCVNSKFLSKDDKKVISLGNNDAWLIKNGFMQDNAPVKPAAETKQEKPANIIAELHLPSEASNEVVKTIEGSLKECNTEAAYIPKIGTFAWQASYLIENLLEQLPQGSTLRLRSATDAKPIIQLTTDCHDMVLAIENVDPCFEAINTLNRLKAA